MLGAAAAGAAGGFLLSNVGTANAASASDQPVTDHIDYHETITGPDGEAMVVDGSMDSSITFDESGDAHVQIHEDGAATFDGETYDYSSDVEGDVDVGDDGGGIGDFFDGLFG
jgi:hypothetical protein